MKKTAIAICSVLLMAVSCKQKPALPDRQGMIDSIEALEMSAQSLEVSADSDEAQKMIDLYSNFAQMFPEDSLAPLYMMRSAEIMVNMGNFEGGISTLDSIIAQYPGFDDLGGCLFLKGRAYEQNQQYNLARATYMEFVDNYPDHVLAADTKKMIPLVGMTPEEQLAAILNSKK